MEAFECIMTRRSVRRYNDTPISEETLYKLLEAGANAPSAGNQQPWHFITVTGKEALQTIADNFPYGKMLPHAACAIIICMNTEAKPHPQFAVQDCSAATQNILLAAHALGLGGVWIGTHPMKEREEFLQKFMSIPANFIPLCVISIGYPESTVSPQTRLKPEMIHKEKW